MPIHYNSFISKQIKKSTIKSQLKRFLKRSLTLDDFEYIFKIFINQCLLFKYSKKYLYKIKREVFKEMNININENGIIDKGFVPCNKCKFCRFASDQNYVVINNKSKYISQ